MFLLAWLAATPTCDAALQQHCWARRGAAAGAPGRHASPKCNLFGDFFDGDKLKVQKPPARPLLPSLVRKDAASYVLQENMFSMSGEDFRVRDVAGNEVLRVEGFNVNIGGFVLDKLGFKDAAGDKFCSVERRAVAASTCYDIYDPQGKLIAKVERELISATPKYNFYYEGDLNPFADFHAEGSFFDRKYTFYAGGDPIARVRRAPELMRDVNAYGVEVAAGADAAAVLAVAVVIDEDHDESDAKKKAEGGGLPWPF